MFTDDISLFPIINNFTTSVNEIIKDWYKIKSWSFQWKINFNPDRSKKVQEIIFSRKLTTFIILTLRFNNSVYINPYIKAPYQKHLGIILEIWLYSAYCFPSPRSYQSNIKGKTFPRIRVKIPPSSKWVQGALRLFQDFSR